ncbi:32091_t:CDS:2 [Racocetra persica]|uniref:32091_t:CDS:1 n=1 Tax=Racocetra persica TaxID=160502 RepID=A0ACA9MHA3_9GLOM|nr:32091_t:CDS:2 [Racocetra persica]
MVFKKFDHPIPFVEINQIPGEKTHEGIFSIIEKWKYREIIVAEISVDEIRKHNNLYCDNVINFHGITVFPDETKCLIMNYEANGNLHDYLANNQLKWDPKLKMSSDIAAGLLHCHDHEIIHLNINSKNILVDKNFELKIAGFGYLTNGESETTRWAVPEDSEMKTRILNTVRWAAPEIFSKDPVMKKHYKENPKLSDIYSYGLVVWEIAMNGIEPYRDMEIDEIKDSKVSGNISDKLEIGKPST